MLKKVMTYLMLFAIFSFLGDSYLKNCIAQQTQIRSPYYLSFASIGANLLESRMDCWAKIRTSRNAEELDQVLEHLLNLLKIPADMNGFLHHENEDIITVEYSYNLNELNFYFLLQTNKKGDYSNLLVTITCKGDDQQLRYYENQIGKLYRTTVYYQYRGVLSARLDTDGQQELLNIMFTNLHATPNDVYTQGPTSSLTGFKPSLKPDSVMVSGHPCNIQAAIRSSEDGKNIVYLGIPLLLNDY